MTRSTQSGLCHVFQNCFRTILQFSNPHCKIQFTSTGTWQEWVILVLINVRVGAIKQWNLPMNDMLRFFVTERFSSTASAGFYWSLCVFLLSFLENNTPTRILLSLSSRKIISDCIFEKSIHVKIKMSKQTSTMYCVALHPLFWLIV